MAAEETLRLIIQTELQNAIGELTKLKEGILELGKSSKGAGEDAKGLSEFEKAFKHYKEEAARAKEVQEGFNKALSDTPNDDQLKEFGKSVGIFGEKAKDATQVVGELVQALGLVAASRAALEFGKEMAAEWGEQESAVLRLNAALAAQGRSSESQGLQTFAGNLQKASGKADDLTISLLGTFAALGRTTPQLVSMGKAAVDLAAGTGMTLPQAMEALNLSLDGQIRGLSMTVPAVRDLTEAQLKNGDAIRLISQLYSGQAAAAMDSLNGKIQALETEFGDMQKSLFEEFAPLVKELVDAARGVVDFVEDLPGPVRTFAVALVALSAAGVGVVGALTTFNVLKPAILASLAQMSGGATTFWAAMTGPVGWTVGIIAGLALITTAFLDAQAKVKEFNEANSRIEAGVATIEDYNTKLKVLNQRIGEIELRRAFAGTREEAQHASEEITLINEQINVTNAAISNLSRNRAGQIQLSTQEAEAARRREADLKAEEERLIKLQRWWGERDSYTAKYLPQLAEELQLRKEIARIETMLTEATEGPTIVQLAESLKIARDRLAELYAEYNKAPQSAFEKAFEQWTKSSAEAETATNEWKAAVEAATGTEEQERLLAYGRSMGYIKQITQELPETASKAGYQFKNLRGVMESTFGDMGAIGAGLIDSLLPDSQKAKLTEHLEKYKAGYAATFQAISGLGKELFSQLNEMSLQSLKDEIDRLEKQLDAHNESTDRQLDARERLGQDTVDFELRAAVDRERIEKDLARKQAELKLKEFRMNQAIRAGEAGINAFAASTAPGILGTPFMGFIIAAGLLQQGMIWAQQPPEVPAFYDGSIVKGSASGILANIGERGQDEMVLPLRREKLIELGVIGGRGDVSIGNLIFTKAIEDPRATARQMFEEFRRLARSGDLVLSELTL